MSDVEPNFRSNVGPCGCGIDECDEYGTYRRKENKLGTFCVKSCTQCSQCRNGNNRLSGLRPQRKEAKRLGARPRSSFGYGNEESSGVELDWEHKSNGEAKSLFTWWNKHVKQVRTANKVLGGMKRPEYLTGSMDDEPYTLCVYRSDQELEFITIRARKLGIIE